MDGHFGLFIGVAYAEPFSSMRPQVYERLPVTPHSRLRAGESTDQWRARACLLTTNK